MKRKKIISIIALLLVILLILGLVIGAISSMANAVSQSDIDALKSQKADLDAKQKDLAKQIADLKDQQASALDQKAALDQQNELTQEEIAIMKMVGASNAFIRFPFVIEGLILGLVGSGLAYLAEWGLYNLVNTRVTGGLAGQLVTVVAFTEFRLPLLIIYLGVGLFIGVFGSLVAIRNYLKV